MRTIIISVFLAIMASGCQTRQLSYTETLNRMDAEFAEAYVNGTQTDAIVALRVFLAKLDELQRHPNCPADFERQFSISRGLTNARLASIQKARGHDEKAKAFITIALTQFEDPQATTEEDIYKLVDKMDAPLNLKWKQKDTQQQFQHVP